ncbi:MAG: hypothetical protein IJG33_09515 [Selenomonadaceae bacterium]|nr:hypothetical protein [Selenomonadaceae bacterium]MBR0288559.1 hypothetical protein [Selenomonadaceae bacterium]
MVKVPKVEFLSSGDATFSLIEKFLRYVNIVGKACKYRSPACKYRSPAVAALPAGTNCRAVSRASRPAVAALPAGTNCRAVSMLAAL